MSTESDTDKTAKYLGIVASVIGILAFLGISNWDDLTGATSPGSVERGDCVVVEIDVPDKIISDLDVVSCNDPDAEYEVLGRFVYDSEAAEEVYGTELDPANARLLNPRSICQLNLGTPTSEESWRSVSLIESGNHEVLCLEDIFDS